MLGGEKKEWRMRYLRAWSRLTGLKRVIVQMLGVDMGTYEDSEIGLDWYNGIRMGFLPLEERGVEIVFE